MSTKRLEEAAEHLEMALGLMKAADCFDQLCSGYGAQTYEETIAYVIQGIRDYLRRQELLERMVTIKYDVVK